MKKIKSVVYGEGGHDETKKNNNVAEIIYYTDEELELLEAEKEKLAKRKALLDRLGLTEDEAKLILG